MSDCERVNFSESEFVTLSNYKAFKPYCVIYFLWRTVGRQTFFTPGNQQKLMTDGASDDGIFPVVVVKVNGVMCRALIDSGAESSYASANLVHMFGKKRVTSKKHFFRCE